MNRRGRAHERVSGERSRRSPEPSAPFAGRIGTAPFLDGVVLHDGRTGRLFQLNRTAAQAWRALRGGASEEAIVGALARTHGLDPASVRRDVRAFIGAAHQAGLLAPGEPDEGEAAAELRPSSAKPALDAAYRVGQAVVRVTCYPAEIAAAFAPLAAPALVPEGTYAEARLALFRACGGFALTCDDRRVERLDTAPAARWAMVRQLVWAARRRRWLALLHAGAIALPAGSLLLCGDSGAGKSSLLAGLVAAGFPFMADDIVPLEAGSGLVWPVRLAISIKEGSWPAIGRLFPELEEAPVVRFGGRAMRYLWPGDRAVPIESAGYAATAVLFPRYVPDAPVTLTRLGAAQALALLGEGGSVLPASDAGLAEFLAWWGRLPAYQLCYGRLEEAVVEVRALTVGFRASRGAAPSGAPAPIAAEA